MKTYQLIAIALLILAAVMYFIPSFVAELLVR